MTCSCLTGGHLLIHYLNLDYTDFILISPIWDGKI